MSPLLPSRRRPWLDDPGHIHEETPPPPMPDEQEQLGPDETLATSPVRTDSAGREMVHEARGPDQEPAGVPDLNEVDVPEELAGQIRAAMARYPQKLSASIPALWAVQKRYGYCSPEGIRQAAAVMGVTPGHLQSVASFYDLFHLEPAGRPRGPGLHEHLLLAARRRRHPRRLQGGGYANTLNTAGRHARRQRRRSRAAPG